MLMRIKINYPLLFHQIIEESKLKHSLGDFLTHIINKKEGFYKKSHYASMARIIEQPIWDLRNSSHPDPVSSKNRKK